MGVPLMIQESDNKRIENLKKGLGVHKKIEVIRAGLDLLDQEVQRSKRIKQWKNAAKLAAKSSSEINRDFQSHSRIKNVDK